MVDGLSQIVKSERRPSPFVPTAFFVVKYAGTRTLDPDQRSGSAATKTWLMSKESAKVLEKPRNHRCEFCLCMKS